jgi:tetratricopeptide (TPR) repeat protein
MAPSPMVAGEGRGNSEVMEVVVTGARIRHGQSSSTSPVMVQDGGRSIEVETAEWNPDRPYLAALEKAAPADFWKVYGEQEEADGTLPAFYLDVAEWLFRHGRAKEAVEVALNALEPPAADTTTLTVLADRLMRYGDDRRALELYEKILALEPDRPQPRRNLALALVARAERTADKAAARKDYERALELLNEVVATPWNSAYDGIELISLMEANRVVAQLKAMGVEQKTLDPRLVSLLDVDLRVVLEWNTDANDMDLWVDEPTGEQAIYSHPKTGIGGRLSNDMTAGYGPEEYLLRKAPGGVYTVRANVFAADRLNPNGATMIRARLFRGWGRPDQKEETLEIELKKDEKGARLVGTIKVADKPDGGAGK